MSTTEMDRARERMQASFKAVDYATRVSREASAELARLILLEQASKLEGLQGMSFESEYQYDDEGGYFQSVSVYPLREDAMSEDETEEFYEFTDTMGGFDVAELATLCGLPTNATEGQITIEEARQRRF